jgi:2-keto-3-deoxy-L-rhamnonate aldolase RhmA
MVVPDAAIASMLGASGVDFVMLDGEHGPFSPSSLRSCVEALKATPANIAVRTATSDATEIQRCLDFGADGVVVPRVERSEQIAAVVRAARYPPEGERGVGAVRANRFGLDTDLEDANARVAVLVVIESRHGVENAEEIAAVAGLDGIMVGPTDLAADLGFAGQRDHERVQDAISNIVRCARQAGLKCGPGPQPSSAAERDAAIIYGFSDVGALTQGGRAAVDEARVRLAAIPDASADR